MKVMWANSEDAYVPRKGAVQATTNRYSPGKCYNQKSSLKREYFDANFEVTAEKSDGVFWNQLFESDKKGTL